MGLSHWSLDASNLKNVVGWSYKYSATLKYFGHIFGPWSMGLEDDRNITVPGFQLPGPALILLGPTLKYEIYEHAKILKICSHSTQKMKGNYSTVHFVDNTLLLFVLQIWTLFDLVFGSLQLKKLILIFHIFKL